MTAEFTKEAIWVVRSFTNRSLKGWENMSEYEHDTYNYTFKAHDPSCKLIIQTSTDKRENSVATLLSELSVAYIEFTEMKLGKVHNSNKLVLTNKAGRQVLAYSD